MPHSLERPAFGATITLNACLGPDASSPAEIFPTLSPHPRDTVQASWTMTHPAELALILAGLGYLGRIDISPSERAAEYFCNGFNLALRLRGSDSGVIPEISATSTINVGGRTAALIAWKPAPRGARH